MLEVRSTVVVGLGSIRERHRKDLKIYFEARGGQA